MKSCVDGQFRYEPIPIAGFLAMGVRLIVYLGIPIIAAVACWITWPTYKQPKFNAVELARGIVTPLGSRFTGDAIPAWRKVSPIVSSEAQVDSIFVYHWLSADAAPDLLRSDEVEERDLTEPIIGIELDDCYFAFAIAGMANPYYSLVTVASEHRQATVTHCAANDLTRVFVDERSSPASQLALAGLKDDGEFVLVVDGKCIAHSAGDFPLQELAHRTMALGDWLRLHPSSKCYLGGLRVAYVDSHQKPDWRIRD